MKPMTVSSPRGNRASGFTLIEVMVAVTVLGITLTSLLYGQAQAIRAQARTQNVTLATLKAMELADQALMYRSELPMAGESKEVEFDPPFDFLQGRVRVEQNEMVPGVSEVYITVSWDPGSVKQDSRQSASGETQGSRELGICFYVTSLQ
jgi:prepilin-type N-terminal cleavage/methylation domain-containing protein